MKVHGLFLATCCTILFFSVTHSESHTQITAGNIQKNVKSKRSSDEFTVEKENRTQKIESSKKKREVSEEESTCENIIQKEEVVMEELLKIIKEFKKYLNSKKGVKGIKMPGDSEIIGEDDKDDDGDDDKEDDDDDDKDDDDDDDDDKEDDDDDDKEDDDDDDKDDDDDYDDDDDFVEISNRRLKFPNKGPYNHFKAINRPIPFKAINRPIHFKANKPNHFYRHKTAQFPVLPKFNKLGAKPYQTQIAKPNKGWRLAEVPRYVNINSTLNRRIKRPHFSNFRRPFPQNLQNNVRKFPHFAKMKPSARRFPLRQNRLKMNVS